jgi:hypothetical protein
MQWIYLIIYNKNSDGVLQSISTVKKLLDSEQNELAVQTVSIEEYVLNTAAESLSEFYSTLRAELDSTLDIILPVGAQPETPSLSYRSSTLGFKLGQTISEAMAVGLYLYDKGKMTQNDQ